jgi:hypothetical protein
MAKTVAPTQDNLEHAMAFILHNLARPRRGIMVASTDAQQLLRERTRLQHNGSAPAQYVASAQWGNTLRLRNGTYERDTWWVEDGAQETA